MPFPDGITSLPACFAPGIAERRGASEAQQRRVDLALDARHRGRYVVAPPGRADIASDKSGSPRSDGGCGVSRPIRGKDEPLSYTTDRSARTRSRNKSDSSGS
jgi:hypothetical protein